MSDAEFDALVEDIDTYGVREPVWTWNKQVIDGRHRVLACEQLRKKCPTREYQGTEAELVAFVLSLNLKRRHLDSSQRAMVAANLSALSIGEKKDGPPIGGHVSTAQAAELMNVGTRSVERARKVIEDGVPELRQAVEKGEVSVAAAAEVAELPKGQQKRLVSQGKVKEAAAAKRPKSDEVEKLKAELEDALGRAEEMAKAQQPLQDEVDFLRKIEDEGDKLKAACAEVKKLQERVRVQEERIRGLTRAHGEAVKAAKTAQAQVARLEKELAKVSA